MRTAPKQHVIGVAFLVLVLWIYFWYSSNLLQQSALKEPKTVIVNGEVKRNAKTRDAKKSPIRVVPTTSTIVTTTSTRTSTLTTTTTVLPTTASTTAVSVTSSTTAAEKGPQRCFVAKQMLATGYPTGGYGNIMCEVTALVALAHITGRVPVIGDETARQRLITKLKDLPNLKELAIRENNNQTCLPALEVQITVDNSCCHYSNHLFEKYKNELSSNMSVTAPFIYAQMHGRFIEKIDDISFIRQMLLPFPNITATVAETLFGRRNITDEFNICLHIRRGDFITENRSYSNLENVSKIGLYLQNKYKEKNPNVLLFGNDYEFGRNTSALYNRWFAAQFNANNSAVIDWEFSRLGCDVAAITATESTYGWFMGFLSRGQRVYYGSPWTSSIMRIQDFFSSNWTHINFKNYNDTIVEEHHFL